jgi:hypothetical protein
MLISSAVLSKAVNASLIIALPWSLLVVASTISRELMHKRKALTGMPLRTPQATGCPSWQRIAAISLLGCSNSSGSR